MEQVLNSTVDIIALLIIGGILALIYKIYTLLFINPRIKKIKKLLNNKDYPQAKDLLLDALQKQPKRKAFINLKQLYDQNVMKENSQMPSNTDSASTEHKIVYNFMCTQNMKMNRFWVKANLVCFIVFVFQCLFYNIVIPDLSFSPAWWTLTMLFSVTLMIYTFILIKNFTRFQFDYFLYQGICGLFFCFENLILYFSSAKVFSDLYFPFVLMFFLPIIALAFWIFHKRKGMFQGRTPWKDYSNIYRMFFIVAAIGTSFIIPLLNSFNEIKIIPWIFLLSGIMFSISTFYFVDYAFTHKYLLGSKV